MSWRLLASTEGFHEIKIHIKIDSDSHVQTSLVSIVPQDFSDSRIEGMTLALVAKHVAPLKGIVKSFFAYVCNHSV